VTRVTAPVLTRGTVFRAEHDASFIGWHDDEPRWKICIAFDAQPPGETDYVHYFMATSNVAKYRENPVLMGDVAFFAKNSYPFFSKETAVDFRELNSVTLAKLRRHGLRIVGTLSVVDVARCERTAAKAMQLLNKHKRLLGLLP
jgi:hypothetical protein